MSNSCISERMIPMQITNFKKWIIPVLLVLILEIGFTFILTGNFTLVYDRKSMLLIAIILTWLILLFTPPEKPLNNRLAASFYDFFHFY